MQRGFFGNLMFAIIARMLGGNHLKQNQINNVTNLRRSLSIF